MDRAPKRQGYPLKMFVLVLNIGNETELVNKECIFESHQNIIFIFRSIVKKNTNTTKWIPTTHSILMDIDDI